MPDAKGSVILSKVLVCRGERAETASNTHRRMAKIEGSILERIRERAFPVLLTVGFEVKACG